MYSRRQLLIGGGVLLVALPGCNESTENGSTLEDDSESELLLVASDGTAEVVLLRYEHIADVALGGERRGGSYTVQVELTDEGWDSFYDGLEQLDATENHEDIELNTYVDGEVVSTARLSPSLAERPDSEADSSSFLITASNRSEAVEFKEKLENAQIE